MSAAQIDVSGWWENGFKIDRTKWYSANKGVSYIIYIKEKAKVSTLKVR